MTNADDEVAEVIEKLITELGLVKHTSFPKGKGTGAYAIEYATLFIARYFLSKIPCLVLGEIVFKKYDGFYYMKFSANNTIFFLQLSKIKS